MNIYQEFAKHLDQLLGGVNAIRIAVPGYLPLPVEEIGFSEDGHRLVSLCHYGEQNGDLMRDPDIVFLFHNLPDGVAAEPVSFRNDDPRLSQEVYRSDETGRRTHVVPALKQDLKEFARAWFVTLRDQGFFAPHRGSRDSVSVISSIHSGGYDVNYGFLRASRAIISKSRKLLRGRQGFLLTKSCRDSTSR